MHVTDLIQWNYRKYSLNSALKEKMTKQLVSELNLPLVLALTMCYLQDYFKNELYLETLLIFPLNRVFLVIHKVYNIGFFFTNF